MNTETLKNKIKNLENIISDLKTKQKHCSMCFLSSGKDIDNIIKSFERMNPNSLDVFWTADMQMNFTYVSPSVYKVRGYYPKEVMKQPIHEIFTPESITTICNGIKESMSELSQDPINAIQKVRTFELQQYHKDGRKIWTEANCTFILSEEGIPVGIQGYTRDISKRKEQEEKIAFLTHFKDTITQLSMKFINLSTINFHQTICEALNQIRIFSSIKDSFLFFEDSFLSDWNLLSSNTQYTNKKKWLSWFKKTFLSQSEKKKNPNAIHISTLKLPESNKTSDCLIVPIIHQTKKIGVFLGVDFSVKPSEKNEFFSLFEICGELLSNIISRMKIEKALEVYRSHLEEMVKERTIKLSESEKKYKALIDATSTGYVIFDEKFTILECNDEFIKMVGSNNFIEIIGTNLLNFIEDKNSFQLTLKSNTLISSRVQIINKTHTIPMEISSRMVETKEGIRYLSLCRDVSVWEKFQKKIISAQRMDSIGNLAGGIAHDFNNILGGISGFAQLSLTTEDPEKLKEYINKILLSVGRAKKITHSLLTYSRKTPSIIEAVSINAICEETSDMVKQLSSKNFNISNSYSKDLWTIDGNPSEILQLTMNLILNASEAVSENGSIFIRTKNYSGTIPETPWKFTNDNNKYTVIEIEDNGCGISDLTLQKIFEPFFTTKIHEDNRGTGLGLATVYAIIQNHKGAMQIETKINKGTLFRIFLPKGNLKKNEVLNIENLNIELKDMNILVADDESLMREFLTNYLTVLGCKITVASNGKEAIEKVKLNKNLSLIIMDIIMPETDGSDAAIIIRKINPEIKILFITGYDKGCEKIKHLYHDKNCGILIKPFNFEELINKISALTENKNSTK